MQLLAAFDEFILIHGTLASSGFFISMPVAAVCRALFFLESSRYQIRTTRQPRARSVRVFGEDL
jgi:hypothetical protein